MITAVADRAYEEDLSDEVQSQEYIRVSGHPESRVFQREYLEDPFAFGPFRGNINIIDMEKSEEWEEFSGYLKKRYDISTNQSILQSLLISIFGINLEHREGYRERITEECESITADADNPACDFKSFVFGLDITSTLSINEVQLRPRRREDVEIDIRRIDQLLPNGSITLPEKSILNTCVLEHSVVGGDALEAKKRGHMTSALTCGLLNIFADANYSLARTEVSGRYFRIGSIQQYPETRIGAQNRFEVTSEDEDRLESLHKLLQPHAADWVENSIFEYPLSVAYHSLQRSWEYKNTYREALGWLLIGLESIVGSNGNISGRVSLLVSTVSDQHKFHEVKDDMDDGFNKRSQWAHGASRKQDDPSPQQMRIRDYLRTSIVAFADLLENGSVDSRKTLRDKLDECLENDSFSDEWIELLSTDMILTDYLRLP